MRPFSGPIGGFRHVLGQNWSFLMFLGAGIGVLCHFWVEIMYFWSVPGQNVVFCTFLGKYD